MATINAPSLLDVVYSGDCPLAAAHGYVTLAAQASGTTIRLNKLYAGTKILDARMIAADMNASTGTNTISLGFEYCNGESGGAVDSFIPATDVAAAATSTQMAVKPVTLLYDAYIIAVTAGSAACTGALDTVVTYEFKGK